MEYFHRITGPKKQIYLVHGEPLRSLALQSALMEEYPGKSFTVAGMGMTVE
jgi:metallo-beta-lactamase family protein